MGHRGDLRVVVSEQTRNQKFHRGALLNAGFTHTVTDSTRAFIAHYCDLVPDDRMLMLYDAVNPEPFTCLAGVGTRYSR